MLPSTAIPEDLQKALPADTWELSEYVKERRFYRSWHVPRIVTVLSSTQHFDPGETPREGFFLPSELYTDFDKESAKSELPERFQISGARKRMKLNDLFYDRFDRSNHYGFR